MAHCMAIPTLPLFVETCPTAATIENGSNVCGAGKPEASYPLVQAFATDNAATVSIGQPSPDQWREATIQGDPGGRRGRPRRARSTSDRCTS